MNDTYKQTDDTAQETSHAGAEEATDVIDTGEGSKGGRAADMEVEVDLENQATDNEEEALDEDTVL